MINLIPPHIFNITCLQTYSLIKNFYLFINHPTCDKLWTLYLEIIQQLFIVYTTTIKHRKVTSRVFHIRVKYLCTYTSLS